MKLHVHILKALGFSQCRHVTLGRTIVTMFPCNILGILVQNILEMLLHDVETLLANILGMFKKKNSRM